MMRKHALISLLAGLTLLFCLALPLAATDQETTDAAALLAAPAATPSVETAALPSTAPKALPAPWTQNFDGYEVQVSYTSSGMCDADEIEVHCSIDSDPCGRSWSAWGCCDNDEIGCCEPIVVTSPPCFDGLSITCQ